MDNAAEQYDLITVLSRLDRSKGKKGEIGQGYSMDERGAATDARRMGRLRKLLASLQRLLAAERH
jgi:hypothetical protein